VARVSARNDQRGCAELHTAILLRQSLGAGQRGQRVATFGRLLKAARAGVECGETLEGTMRLALLTIVVIAAFGLPAQARTNFDCFVTPQGETRCACEGDDSCRAMDNSKACVTDPECDDGELGVTICSCRATPASRSNH
jgi:hypothetical protein